MKPGDWLMGKLLMSFETYANADSKYIQLVFRAKKDYIKQLSNLSDASLDGAVLVVAAAE